MASTTSCFVPSRGLRGTAREGIAQHHHGLRSWVLIDGLYKAEVIHRRGPWSSFEAVEFATLEWVDWFNNRRLLAAIGFIAPAEAEERYYASLDEPAMAAYLKQHSLRQSRGGS